MGLTIKGKYAGSPSYDMGYASFYRLRRDIAYTVSDEYGQHYEKIPEACAELIDVACYDLRTEKLIKKYHLKERFLSFLYQPDAEGKLSPFMCKALLEQIGSFDSDALYGYAVSPEYCLTITKFKELLRQCFERKTYLIWH